MSDSPSRNSTQSDRPERHQVAIPEGKASLVPCSDCGNECSPSAKSCPRCGRIIQNFEPPSEIDQGVKASHPLGILIIALLVLATIIFLMAPGMSLCLIVLVICCKFVLELILILRFSNPGTVGIKEHAEASYKKLVAAKNMKEFIGALLYASFILSRGGLISLAVPIATAAFGALAGICGGLDVERLQILRLMLLDLYNFIERLVIG